MPLQICTPRLAALGLRPITACGDTSATLPPLCIHSWSAARRYNGSSSTILADHQLRHAARCARHAFEAYLCSLPAEIGDDGLKPADWAFGASPPSVGKSVAHFAMQLYLSATQARPFRNILPNDALMDWRWRPMETCHGLDSSTPWLWLKPDVCDHSERRTRLWRRSKRGEGGAAATTTTDDDPSFEQTRTGSRLLQLVRGNTSGHWRRTEDPLWVATAGGGATTAGFWTAGMLVRRVWRHAVGPCTRLRVDALLRDANLRLGVSRSGSLGAGNLRSNDGGEPFVPLQRPRRLAVAVHIRRGDACERWASEEAVGTRREDGLPRPCFATHEYLAAARALLAQLRGQRRERNEATGGGVAWLLVATDSPTALTELRGLIQTSEFELLHANGPRGAAWGGVAEGANVGRTRQEAAQEFIEARNDRGLIDRGAVVSGFFADLELLARADAFVGTAASWTSRVALLAIVGETGSVPPFVMLDRPLGKLWFA